ncbi:4Fe-4S dicluster domain-containing protein [Thermanaerosceptrum fracticalcis]|nr:4Fe-4S dicluster domain-containing protein [Thermanaerosceptrum fracticalcis]
MLKNLEEVRVFMERINLTPGLAQAKPIRDSLKEHYGTDVGRCYQCGKCTAGCPVAFAMDYTPREIVRLLQLGLKEEALKSKTIWLCATCDTCSTRCPREVEPAKLMEGLRQEAKAKGLVADKRLDLFNDLFLQLVEKYGRVHEMGLILKFNLLSAQPLKDAGHGPGMFLKGKINPLPHTIKDNGEVKQIFARVRDLGGEGK